MNTRCKPGDLAVIINEVSSCAGNIGRLVRVDGPPRTNDRGQVTWLIEPVTNEPYMVNDDMTGEFIRYMEVGELGLEHPDGWMMPIHLDDGELIAQRDESPLREIEVVTCR